LRYDPTVPTRCFDSFAGRPVVFSSILALRKHLKVVGVEKAHNVAIRCSRYAPHRRLLAGFPQFQRKDGARRLVVRYPHVAAEGVDEFADEIEPDAGSRTFQALVSLPESVS
jgi:hypothetical protein